MNKASQKVKDWLLSKVPHPEALSPNDDKMLNFFIEFFMETMPQFIGIMVLFALLSYMYLWGYRKYGFERTIIVMLVNLVIVVSQVSKAINKLGQG